MIIIGIIILSIFILNLKKKEKFDCASDMSNKITSGFSKLGSTMTKPFSSAFGAIGKLFGQIWKEFTDALGDLGSVAKPVLFFAGIFAGLLFLTPLFLFLIYIGMLLSVTGLPISITFLVGLIPVFIFLYKVYSDFQRLKTLFGKLFEKITKVFTTIYNKIFKIIDISKFTAPIKNALGDMFKVLFKGLCIIIDGLKKFIDKIKKVVEEIKKVPDAIGGAFNAAGKWVGNAASDAGKAIGGVAKDVGGAIAGVFCFTGETLVMLSDGSSKMIKNIEIGDKIIGWGGTYNTVSHVEIYENYFKTKDRQIYGFNNINPFFTDGHVFMTTEGWKSINPEQTLIELPNFIVKKLQVGDIMFKLNHKNGKMIYEPIPIKKFTSKIIPDDKLLYNLGIVGNYSYHANSFATHNMYDIEDSDETELDSIEDLSPEEVKRLRNAVQYALPEVIKVFGLGPGLELIKGLNINPEKIIFEN